MPSSTVSAEKAPGGPGGPPGCSKQRPKPGPCPGFSCPFGFAYFLVFDLGGRFRAEGAREGGDVGGVEPLFTLDDIEGDFLACLEGFVSLHRDGRVIGTDIVGAVS